MQKLSEMRQNYVTRRMLALRGFRYFRGITEVSKFEIAHSGLDIRRVIAGHTLLTIKKREDGSE